MHASLRSTMTKTFRDDVPRRRSENPEMIARGSLVRDDFLLTRKRRARRADNRASGTRTHGVTMRWLAHSWTQVNAGWRLTSTPERNDRGQFGQRARKREDKNKRGRRKKKTEISLFDCSRKRQERQDTYPINQSTVSRRYSGNLSSLDDFRVDHRREENSARDSRENKV